MRLGGEILGGMTSFLFTFVCRSASVVGFRSPSSGIGVVGSLEFRSRYPANCRRQRRLTWTFEFRFFPFCCLALQLKLSIFNAPVFRPRVCFCLFHVPPVPLYGYHPCLRCYCAYTYILNVTKTIVIFRSVPVFFPSYLLSHSADAPFSHP
jgi:hypothetical protein